MSTVPTPQPTLAQAVRTKYPGVYDDLDDYTLEQKVLVKYPQYSDLPQTPKPQATPQPPMATVKAAPKRFTLPWLKENFYNAADEISNTLPAVGAGLGAILGGTAGSAAPGAGTIAGGIGGAGIGGMGGEAARQLTRRALGFESPQTSQEAANQIAREGMLQSTVQGIGEVLPFLAPALKRSALGQYERALSPTTKINKAITSDIAPEMMQRGVYGSLEGINKQAGKQAATLNPQLNAAYNALPQSATAGSGDQVINALEQLKGKYMVNNIPAQPAAINAINGVQDIVRAQGADISPTSLRQLKQIFDEPVAAKGGYAGGDLTLQYTAKAQRAAANSIRGILSQASPNIAALNKELSFWLDVQRVTGQTALRRTGQEGGLMRVLGIPFMMGGGGAAGHAIAGGRGALEGTAAGFLTAAATMIVRSPAWRTMSAVAKDRLATALASGDVGTVVELGTRFGVAGLQSYQRSAQSSPTVQQQPQ